MLFTFGECRLDLNRRELHVAGAPVHLTPKAFELLRVLLENRARAVSKAELFEAIWPGVFVSDDSLARLVAEVRGAISDTPRNAHWLRTIHGYGYAFAASTDATAEPVNSRFALQCGSRQFLLSPGEHLIGRDATSAVPMHSPGISRRHARVLVTPRGATIEDLGSKNGTYVGDERLDGERLLHEGDRIRIGDFTFVFTSLESLATETMAL